MNKKFIIIFGLIIILFTACSSKVDKTDNELAQKFEEDSIWVEFHVPAGDNLIGLIKSPITGNCFDIVYLRVKGADQFHINKVECLGNYENE